MILHTFGIQLAAEEGGARLRIRVRHLLPREGVGNQAQIRLGWASQALLLSTLTEFKGTPSRPAPSQDKVQIGLN